MNPRVRLALFAVLFALGCWWALSVDRLNFLMAVGIVLMSAGCTMAVDKVQRGGW